MVQSWKRQLFCDIVTKWHMRKHGKIAVVIVGMIGRHLILDWNCPSDRFINICQLSLHHSLHAVLVWFQVMAVDIQYWAQSLARWPLRAIRAPTPATPGASGGFVFQRGARCDSCLGILTLRAVQAAATALLWSQTRTATSVWVSLLTTDGVSDFFLIHIKLKQKCSHSCWFFSEIPADRLFMLCVITDVLQAMIVEHTPDAIPLTQGKPSFATQTSSNQVYEVKSRGHKNLTTHQNEAWEIQEIEILC